MSKFRNRGGLQRSLVSFEEPRRLPPVNCVFWCCPVAQSIFHGSFYCFLIEFSYLLSHLFPYDRAGLSPASSGAAGLCSRLKLRLSASRVLVQRRGKVFLERRCEWKCEQGHIRRPFFPAVSLMTFLITPAY